MKSPCLALMAACAAAPLFAEETRQLDAHVHGIGTLRIAVEGNVVDIALDAPGMDIVGFEYAASSPAEKDAVDTAIRAMLTPETLLTLPNAAECRLTGATAMLAREAEHAHHEEAGHDDDDHDHGHDHDHDHDHEGEKEAKGGGHSEFQARYVFDCAHPEDLTRIGLPFFERFSDTARIEAQFVTEAGAGAADIDRNSAELILP